jgi:hypothetical protein
MIRGTATAATTVGACALLLAAGQAQAIGFTFAGYTFEQDYTPDTLALLGNGAVLGGATFSAGTVTNITQSVAFVAASVGGGGVITPQAGFDPSLTLGRQANAQYGLVQPDTTSCLYGCAINMPAGNNQSVARRHGIDVSWSGGRQLVNGTGDDFVIYESSTGTAISGREAYMVRLGLSDGSFTGWRYEIVDSVEAYLATTDGATATAFDLSSFGIADGGVIAAIQVATLLAADRVDGAGFGNMNFGGVGNVPLSSLGGAVFGSGARDPDPLYVGVLGTVQVVPVPAAVWLFGAALGVLGFARRRAA